MLSGMDAFDPDFLVKPQQIPSIWDKLHIIPINWDQLCIITDSDEIDSDEEYTEVTNEETVGETLFRTMIDDDIVDEILWGSMRVYVILLTECLDDDPKKRPTMLDVVDQPRKALSLQQAGNIGGVGDQ